MDHDLEPTDPWGAPKPADPDPWELAEADDFEVPEGFKAGYVALIGRPNVGKSSLVNSLVGERLAPTSPVPQTTRRRLLGILSLDQAQVVFVDTPGIHKPTQRLGELMVSQATGALMDADVVLCVVDLTREPGEEDRLALQLATRCEVPRFLIMNKLDLVPDGGFRAAFEAQPELDRQFHVSALRGDGLPDLLAAIVEKLPEAPPFFPTDQLTDVYEREVASDLIREAALGSLNQELPHAIAVKVEEWKERDNGMLYVSALLIVERESQKGIVIGRGGQMLKGIGIQAREKLEGWLQKRVYLELQVKVMKKWRKNENALRWLGFVEGR